MKDLQSLLQSSEENERKEGILFFPREAVPENVSLLAQLAEHDESIEIRFLARKALHQFKKHQGEGEAPPTKKINTQKILEYFAGSEEDKLAIIEHVTKSSLVQALPIFVEQLGKETDPKVLASLLMAIGRLGSEPEIRIIAPYLRNESPRVRANAVEAMELVGSVKAYPFILSCLKDEDNRVRANAVKAVRILSPLSTIRIIRQMIASNYVSMQASAAYALGFFPSEENLTLVTALLDSPDENVQGSAVKTLSVFAKKGVATALRFLSERFPEVAARLEPAAPTPEPAATRETPLTAALKDPDPMVRIREIQKSVHAGDQSIAKQILGHLKTESDMRVVATIILGFGHLQIQTAAPILKKALGYPENRCRANAVEALRLLNNPENFPALIPLLKDPNNRVRANAIVALKDCPDVDVLVPLKEMLASGEEVFQKSAIYAILELKTAGAYRLLAEAAQSAFPEVAQTALKAMEEAREKGAKIPAAPPTPASMEEPEQISPKNPFTTMGQKPEYASWNLNSVEKLGFMLPPDWQVKSIKPSLLFFPATARELRLPQSKRVVHSQSLMVTIGSTPGESIDGKATLTKRKDDLNQFFEGYRSLQSRTGKSPEGSDYVFLTFDHTLEGEPFTTASLALVEGIHLYSFDLTVSRGEKDQAAALFERIVKSLHSGFSHLGGELPENIFSEKPAEATAEGSTSSGKAGAHSEVLKPFSRGDLFGYQDSQEKEIIPPQFDEAGHFNGGLARVLKKGACFYIDPEGRPLLSPQFALTDFYSESLALIKIGDEWGYIDINGEIVVKPLFAQIALMLFLFDAEMNWQICCLDKTG